MKFSTFAASGLTQSVRVWLAGAVLALLLPGLLARPAQAQAPAWAATLAPDQLLSGTALTRGTAVNAAGDVFITGYFSGQVAFGSTTLSSTGSQDVFVAKWNTAASTWAWAVSGGGTAGDQGLGIAVSGTGVFVTGYITNSSTNGTLVQFGGSALNGATTTVSNDVFVAKYTDATTSATYNWATAGGGTGSDQGQGIAVSGAGIYVTGYITNTSTNGSTVQFGGSPLSGASTTSSQDVLVAKYTDATSSATFNWATAGGGTGTDQGFGIAVSGAGVFVTGTITNTIANGSTVQFGGSPLNGASTTSSYDVLVAKYTDATSSATYNWATAGGGTGSDQGQGIAVSGAGIYVTGYITNTSTNGSTVQFGGSPLNGASTTSSNDVLVAKYTDATSSATYNWATAGGGTSGDFGQGIAVSGTGVYVTGYITNTIANGSTVQFGGTNLNGASSSNSNDAFVAKYTDATSSATSNWATAAGGTGNDIGYSIAFSGSTVQVGFATGAGVGTFGSIGPLPLNAAGRGALAASTGLWQNANTGRVGGTCQVRGTALNANGDVFITGYFTGQVAFGSTTLTSAGSQDVFVAKWNTAAGTWAWAVSGGGTGADQGQGIAVSGTGVYVTGNITNTIANAQAVQFGGSTLIGASTSSNSDVLVAKYTDATTSATFNWARAGGGTSADQGFGIAVSGTGVYVTGLINNSIANAQVVQFGGSTLIGASTTTSNDVFVAKYTDATSTATYNWATAGGGTGSDLGNGIVVSGTGLYVTGTIQNTSANASLVQFSGTPLNGASTTSSFDVLVAKYTDATSSATFNWASAGGGTASDVGYGIAVSGTGVYVTGFITNSSVNGNTVQFGGSTLNGATTTPGNDVFVAKYTDATTSATSNWATAGGGTGTDLGQGIAVSGNLLVTAGYIAPPATFGSYSVTGGTTQLAAGGILALGPVITGFTPTSGVAGTSIALTGLALTGASSVSVNGVAVTPTGVSSTGLTFVVPAGASNTQSITVTATGGTSPASTAFVVKLNPIVTGTSPVVNALTAPLTNSALALGFTEPVSLGAAANLKVFSAQVGGLKTGTVSTSGSTATYTSSLGAALKDFKPGETVCVTVPATVLGAGGLANTAYVYQFTTATALATGTFAAKADFGTGSNPFGVALGDVNGDGKLDMVTANFISDNASVLLGTGTGTFGPKADYSTGASSFPYAVALGDVNGDGKLDIVTANNNSGSASVLLGTGTGTFGANTNYGTGFGTASVALGDMNGDGTLDIVTANSNAGSVSVLLGTGTGAFGAKTDFTVGSNPFGAALGDVNSDGRLDIVSANANTFGGAGASVLLGTGAGSFGAKTDYATGAQPYGVALGDVNSDGRLDIVTANSTGNNASVLLGTGTGSFGANTNYVTDSGPKNVALGDVNGDGWLDIATANGSTSTASVLLGTGAGSFGAKTDYTTGTTASAVALGDVNGDGRLDMVTSNDGSSNASVLLGLGPIISSVAPGTGVAGTGIVINGTNLSGATAVSVNGAAATITGNTTTTVNVTVPAGVSNTQSITVTAASGTSAAYTSFVVKLNTSSNSPAANARTAPVANSAVGLTFTEPVTAASVTTVSTGIKVFSAQVGGRKAGTWTGGGTSSIAYTSSLPGSRANFKAGELVSVSVPATVLGAGGLAANKKVYQFTTAVSGTGVGNFLSGTEPAVGSAPLSMAVGDVDGDGDLDVLAPNFNNNTVSVRLNGGDASSSNTGVFSNGSTPAVGSQPTSIAVGDVDGDGDLDFVTADLNSSGTVSVRLNGGDATGSNTGVFSNGSDPAVGSNPNSVVLGDVDGDGDLDLLTANNSGSTVSVRLNGGDASGSNTGTFSNGTDPGVGTGPASVAVGDVDGDGDLDFVTANYRVSGTASVRLNGGDASGSNTGVFSNGSNPSVGTQPYAVVLGDVDGDGDLDFVTANAGGNTVSVRLNGGNASGSNTGVFAGGTNPVVGSSPNGVAVGDADGDGDLDLFTANLNSSGTVSVRLNGGDATGSNTGVFSNGSDPAVGSNPNSVVLGDVDGDGDLDLLTANVGSNTVSVRLNQPPVPTITSFTPTSGRVGSVISITGTNLTGATAITFSGSSGNVVSTGFTVASPTSITGVVVPAGAITGTLTVTTPSGMSAASASSFTVTPSLSNLVLSAGSLSPTFASGTTSYTLTVPGTTTTTTVTPTNAQSAGGTITVNSTSVPSGTASTSIALNPGSNSLTVVVNPAGAGTAATYTVTVTRTPCVVTATAQNVSVQLDASGNATVSAADVNNGSSSTCGAVTLGLSQTAFSCANVGAPVAVTLTVTDGFGGSSTAAATVTVTIPTLTSTTWTGASSTAWTACANWSYGQVPTASISAMLPAGMPRYPSLPAGTYPVLDLTLASGSSLTTASTATVQVSGSFANNGATANLAGPVVFTGSAATQTLGGSANTSFATLEVNKASGSVALGRDLPITTALTLTSGTLSTGSFKVNLANTATISETETSYVTGAVETTRVLATAGTGSSFGGIGVTLTPAASSTALPGSTFVRRVTGSPATGVSSSTGIGRYFAITPTVDLNLNVTLVMAYADHELNGIAENRLKLFKSETGAAGPWARVDYAAYNATANTVTRTNIASLSTWTLGNADAPLPVELLAFTAEKHGTAVALAWRTASEQNSDRFEIEHSRDGRTFERIGTVAAKGSMSSPSAYAFLDSKYPGETIVLYYRLRQVDTNGTASYSPVRAVAVGGKGLLTLYPNPVAHGATAHMAFAVPAGTLAATATLLNALGQVVRVVPLPVGAGQATGTLSTAGLAAGVYVLRLSTGAASVSQRLVLE